LGNWGLGFGDWELGPIPNPQSPIPNPQSPLKIIVQLSFELINKFKIIFILYNFLFFETKKKYGTK